MNLLDILAFYNQAHVFVKEKWEIAKEALRIWLGPSRQDYLLLDNGDILPLHMARTFAHEEGAFLYDAKEQSIRPYATREGRLRRLPWLSVQHTAVNVATDLSDIVADMRATHIPRLQQIIRLAALLRNEYLSEKGGTQVKVITAMGEEEVFVYTGSVELKKVV